MTSKPLFKISATIIFTALFGYLMYTLVDLVRTKEFFRSETDTNTMLLGTVLIVGPVILTILCSIIRKRLHWLLSIANMFIWSFVGAALGDETTMAHAYVYGMMILVPFILCLLMIIGEKKEYKADPYPVSSSSSYDDYSPSSSFGTSSTGSLSFSEKEAYIIHNCHGAYSTTGMEKIENDPNLTASQKEELKHHLFHYGD